MKTARQFKNKVFMSCLKSSALCLPPSIRCLVCCQCLIPVLLPVGKRIFVSLPLVSKSELFTLKPKQSKISCSPVTVCVWLQGGGNVRGMTVPSAVPQPLPSVISAHAPFVGTTRKGHSPPLHLKTVSAAPVTTLPVPWAPTPALPSHTAPPRAPSE